MLSASSRARRHVDGAESTGASKRLPANIDGSIVELLTGLEGDQTIEWCVALGHRHRAFLRAGYRGHPNLRGYNTARQSRVGGVKDRHTGTTPARYLNGEHIRPRTQRGRILWTWPWGQARAITDMSGNHGHRIP